MRYYKKNHKERTPPHNVGGFSLCFQCKTLSFKYMLEISDTLICIDCHNENLNNQVNKELVQT
jgi:hypothetical protein